MRLWKEAIFDLREGAGDSEALSRLHLMTVWKNDPWAWLTGRDTDGRPIIWTVDERDDVSPIKPFPAEKDYLRDITYELQKYRIVFIDKVRQMIVTTLCALLIDWYATFNEEREIFVSRVKEDSAIKLINDKIRTVHKRKPKWLQAIIGMSDEPQSIIKYENGTTVTGVAQNFAKSDARGSTGSLIFIDEAAYQEYFPEVYQAVLPMTTRLWAVSTANIGNPGASLFKKLAFEGRPGYAELQMEMEAMSGDSESN